MMTDPNNIEDKIFALLIEYVETTSKIAVAVSGGSDSMALLWALVQYKRVNDPKLEIIALTVDHKLREAGAIEAKFVADFCEQNAIEHHTLTWQHEAIDGNVQKKARNARFRLMHEFCLEQNISKLFLAHHQSDKIETFLMRLKKGSDLKGLSSIKNNVKWGDIGADEISLVRPFLNLNKTDLQNYLRNNSIEDWIEDPSNKNEDYERVQVRNLLINEPYLKDANFTKSIDRISDANDALEFYTDQTMMQSVRFLDLGVANFDVNLINHLPKAIFLKMFARLIWSIGGKDEPTRWQKIEQLAADMKQEDFKKSVLGNCFVIKKKHLFWFGYENRENDVAFDIIIKENSHYLWQNRLLIENNSSVSIKLERAEMGDLNSNLSIAPKIILKNIPKLSSARKKWWQLDVKTQLVLRR